MNRVKRIFSIALITALIAGCASMTHPDPAGQSGSVNRALLGMKAPAPPASGDGEPPRLAGAETLAYEADGPYPVNLADIPARVYDPNHQLARIGDAGRIESPISDELAELLAP